MTLRTSVGAVALIVKANIAIAGNDLSGLAPFVELANNMVTRLCTASSYDDATLELIERWLSAHFYAVRDKTIQRAAQSAGETSDTFDLQLVVGLGSTMYGAQVMIIDSAGNLAAADRRARAETPKAGAVWLGTPPRRNGYPYGEGSNC